MKIILLFSLLINISLGLVAKDPAPKKLCKSFNECITLAEKTDIHRKKISLYDEALVLVSDKDGISKKTKVNLLRANSLIREANGDTGYKGDLALKVTHKPEYKKAQYTKANTDLLIVQDHKAELSASELKLFEELQGMIESEK
ncbi:MAG: hypothetical protein SH817_09400 [Leptospira sp.]|nr:hypothetical protein [Leptospira sp.]